MVKIILKKTIVRDLSQFKYSTKISLVSSSAPQNKFFTTLLTRFLLCFDNHTLAIIKGDPETPGKTASNDRFLPEDTDCGNGGALLY